MIGLQPCQTPINSLTYIFRFIRKDARAVRQAFDPELRRQKDLFPSVIPLALLPSSPSISTIPLKKKIPNNKQQTKTEVSKLT